MDHWAAYLPPSGQYSMCSVTIAEQPVQFKSKVHHSFIHSCAHTVICTHHRTLSSARAVYAFYPGF